MPQTFSFSSAFNDSRQVRYTETFTVAVFHHAQLRAEGGKGIICNFGFGGGNYREQGGFPSIRETNKTHISQHFQFEHLPAFRSRFSGLGVLRRLVGGCGKLGISKSPATAL